MRPYQWFPSPNTTHLLPIWSTVWLNLWWLKALWMNLSTCTEGSSLDIYLPPTVRILHASVWCHAGNDKPSHSVCRLWLAVPSLIWLFFTAWVLSGSCFYFSTSWSALDLLHLSCCLSPVQGTLGGISVFVPTGWDIDFNFVCSFASRQ